MDYRLLADEVLLKLLRINDELAFKELYKRHWQKLFYSVLNKIDSKEVAEDIVQTVFTDLWYRREGLSIDNIPAYLQASVRNRVINYIRFAISNKAHLSNFTERQKPGQDDADMRLLVQELNTAIDRAIRQMPEKTQTVFRLSRFERQSNKEISRIMNLSEKAVEYHIRQSLKILRIYLKDFMLVDYFLVIALMIN